MTVFRRVAGVAGTFVCAAALVLALLAPGVRWTEVDLHDGGVWVTNAKERLVAHLNYPARQLDTGLRARSASFDVFQHGESVLLADIEEQNLARINVSRTVLEDAVEYQAQSVTAGGDTVAVSDPVSGKVWIQHAHQFSRVSDENTPAAYDAQAPSLTAVGVDGTVHAFTPSTGVLVTLGESSDKEPSDDTTYHEIAAVASPEHDFQVSAVGKIPVVLDKTEGVVLIPGREAISLPGRDFALQAPGVAGNVVLVASEKELFSIDTASGQIRPFPAADPSNAAGVAGTASVSGTASALLEGKPSRPAFHGACFYSAWSKSGLFLRVCPEEDSETRLSVDSLRPAQNAVFRTNRDVIVLNDVDSGGLWLPDRDMLLVDNWDQIKSSVDSKDENEEESPEQTDEVALPERTENNTAPEALPDEFGVRAGRNTILPVLWNDSDPDGDVLTAQPTSQPSFGEVSVARDGGALQIAVAADARGTQTFDYQVSDGRGGLAQASVTLSVRDDSVNKAPVQHKVPHVSLTVASQARIQTLSDWYDPDGDPFFLEKAISPAGIQTRLHDNGSLDIAEVGHGPGKDTVELYVSDGREVGQGSLELTINTDGDLPPVANSDFVTLRLGESILFDATANDTDPNADPLRVIQIGEVPSGVHARLETGGQIRISGKNPGSYYLNYTITDTATTASSFIRIDVADVDVQAPPVAEADIALLPEGGHALVDLIANDSDPTGGVLIVQKVDLPQGTPLDVSLIDHHLVRVSARNPLTEPVSFTYTVSNGAGTATSTVTVLPRSGEGIDPRPEAKDDILTIRSGDVGSVAVLANDRSPHGLKLTVAPDLQVQLPADVGTVFVSDNVIRVRGGHKGGAGVIIYTVTDSAGRAANATVHVNVQPLNEESNTAPVPRDLTARTLAGSTTSIPIPLFGIDPDGDSVTLISLGSSPKMGSARVETGSIVYEASLDAQGTDTFTYIVEDRLGKQGTGTIQVGVSSRAAHNQKPSALPDQVLLRPNTKAAVAVLLNDVDPDGDPISLTAESAKASSEDVKVSTRSDRVLVRTTSTEGTFTVSYTITDTQGASTQGTLFVIVSKNAPQAAPIARDDEANAQDVQNASTITIDVLRNDEDPDGDLANLVISSPDKNVTIGADKRVNVPVTDQPQTLIYTLTDQDGLSASAIIRVPGKELVRPTLKQENLPIRVKAGQSVDIPLNTYIRARDGRNVIITSENTVSTGPGHGDGPVSKDPSTLVFNARKDFAGPTSITVEVTDGASAQDPDGQRATLTLPILVESANNRPPTFTAPHIEITPGGSALTVNLATGVQDPDGDDPAAMTYALVSSPPPGITASISGSTLTLQADLSVKDGNSNTLRIRITDPQNGNTEGVVPINITANERPLIQLATNSYQVKNGDTIQIDVASLATNPYPEKGPIQIVGTPTVSSRPQDFAVSVSGTVITVHVSERFLTGQSVVPVTLRYAVVDATENPRRQVTGTVSLLVRSEFAAPTAVRAQQEGSDGILVSWREVPESAFANISYRVTDHTQGDVISCHSSPCLLSGRTVNVDHVISVVAHDEATVSPPSEQVTVHIRRKPSTPSAPRIIPALYQLEVVFDDLTANTPDLSEIEVELSPESRRYRGPFTSPVVFSGDFGVLYRARVRVFNVHGEASEWSAFSYEVMPSAIGDPISEINLEILDVDSPDYGSVRLSWVGSYNIDPAHVSSFGIVCQDGSGEEKRYLVPGSQYSLTMSLRYSDHPYECTISAVPSFSVPLSIPPGKTSFMLVQRPLEVHAPILARVEPTGVSRTIRVEARRGLSMLENRYPVEMYWAPFEGGPISRLDDTVSILSSDYWIDGVESYPVIWNQITLNGQFYRSKMVALGPISTYRPPVLGSVHCNGVPSAEGVIACHWFDSEDGGRPSRIRLLGTRRGESAENGEELFNFTIPFRSEGSMDLPVGHQPYDLCLYIEREEHHDPVLHDRVRRCFNSELGQFD